VPVAHDVDVVLEPKRGALTGLFDFTAHDGANCANDSVSALHTEHVAVIEQEPQTVDAIMSLESRMSTRTAGSDR
jgi:hypothetical protein